MNHDEPTILGIAWAPRPQITPITGPRLGSLRNAWKYFATRQGEKFTKVPFFGPALPLLPFFLVVANEALPVGLKWFPGCLLRAIVKIGLLYI